MVKTLAVVLVPHVVKANAVVLVPHVETLAVVLVLHVVKTLAVVLVPHVVKVNAVVLDLHVEAHAVVLVHHVITLSEGIIHHAEVLLVVVEEVILAIVAHLAMFLNIIMAKVTDVLTVMAFVHHVVIPVVEVVAFPLKQEAVATQV